MEQKTDLVVLDNSLITASYHLTLNEKRLIWCAIKQIPKGVPIKPNTPFFITREDFIELGVNPNLVAREIRQATRDLLKRTVKFLTPIGEVEIPWLYEVLRFDKQAEEKLKVRYPNEEDYFFYINNLRKFNFLDTLPFGKKNDDDDIVARVIFHEKMLPLLSDLKARFTSIDFHDVKEFSSFYTYRFYELLTQYLNEETGKGWVHIEIEKIKHMLVLKDKYKLFADFKKRVIDPSIAEINEKSPLSVHYELIKKGRKFTEIRFIYQRKETEKPLVKNIAYDLFSEFSEAEQAIIKMRIDEHIKRLESKGETVGDFHYQNIVKKATSERWGLDIFEKEQAREKAKKERLEKQLAEEKTKKERQKQQNKLNEQRNNEMIVKFESLTSEQQEFVIDLVKKKVNPVSLDIFKRECANKKAHKNPMFIKYFCEILGY